MIPLNINGKPYQADVAPDTPLLWVLRDTPHLTGTKLRLRPGPVRRLYRPWDSVPTRLQRARLLRGQAQGDHHR